MNKFTTGSIRLGVLGGLIAGIVLSFIVFKMFFQSKNSVTSNADDNAPLYWVAPMDPNYQRDKPGLSPMGMDLVPVYKNNMDGAEQSPGTIKIHPNIVNNMGVRTAKAERKALNVEIGTVGYVKYSEDTLVHVHPRVEGWIEVLNVKAAGTYVKKGDPLYALYSPELVNAQEEFLVAVKRANKNLIAASKSRLQAMQMPASAISKLVADKTVQQTVVFTAPQTGFIDNLNIREGFYVQPGKTLMSIGALDEVWVDAEIFERQSNLVKLGLPVSMTLAYLPGRTWEGKVDYIYPTLDAATRTLRVRIRFSNEDYFLKPNMFANVTIYTRDDALSLVDSSSLVVPSEAVIRTGTQNRVVLALGEGEFKSVEVRIGQVFERDIEILSGLMEGDLVVISAQFLLDSESSISSDFMRIDSDSAASADMSGMNSMSGMNMSKPTWVSATVDDLMPDERMVKLTHEDIDEWGMPGMTMNFVVLDSVDFTQLKVAARIEVQLQKPETGMFEIMDVKP
ncbi:MAG: Cu(I)/Ag(I) efflux system membrane fusion protein [Glaciecola sp.]|jgi:Cu(I)/Ag(I) efflux system membrane fusion protein